MSHSDGKVLASVALAGVTLLLACGCVSSPPFSKSVVGPAITQDKVEAFRESIDHRQFQTAFHQLDGVLYELRDVDEGAAGFEYQLLMSCTAGTGQKEWVAIFADPRIPVERKVDLVRAIDAATSP